VLLDGEGPCGADEVEIVGGAIGFDGSQEMLESGIEVGAAVGGILRRRFRGSGGSRELSGGLIEDDAGGGHTYSGRNGGGSGFELHAGFAALQSADWCGRERF
jgi:hypothetical protein